MESKIPAPVRMDGPSLADWAEGLMLVEEHQRLSRTSVRRRLRGAVASGQEETEFAVDVLMDEVSYRSRVAPEVYPFLECDTGIERNSDKDSSVYEFLLWLAISPVYREEDRYREIDGLFDKLVKQALVKYTGSRARGVRFAFPSSDGRPPGFPEAIKWLAGLLNLSPGMAVARPKVKDAGVDVVVWSPFGDRRTGFVVVLAQCTVQLEWTEKAKDIVLGNWCGLIDFGLHPLSALAVPFAVPRTFEKWDELRRTVNMVLDRLRLCELLTDADSVEDIDRIREWTERERELLEWTADA